MGSGTTSEETKASVATRLKFGTIPVSVCGATNSICSID